MRRIKSVWILLLWAVALFPIAGWAADSGAGTPKLVIPEGQYQFEPVLENEYVSHAFTVQNKGGVALKIFNVKGG